MNEKKKKLGFKLFILSLLLLPGLQVLFIIGCNSDYLIKLPIFITIILLIVVLIVLLILGIKLFIKNKNANKKRLNKFIKVLFSIFMTFYIIGCVAFVLLLYGPNHQFKNWLITTAMQTMNHQYYCKIFYSETTINEIIT